MKVIALTLTTLCLAITAQAYYEYNLKCTREEVGIRWPSYYSNSEYFVCQREGGKQFKVYCPPGEIFTFVLQSCTTPNRFIPPPALDVLPTSPPVSVQPQPLPIEDPFFPLHPPVIIDEHKPIWELPMHHIPPNAGQLPEQPEEPVPAPEDIPGPPSKPVMPNGKPKPEIPAVPTPPTPAPTPPVKQTPQKPTGKKPSTTAVSSKIPVKKPIEAKKPVKKQQLKPLDEVKKQQPPKPEIKNRAPVPPGKA